MWIHGHTFEILSHSYKTFTVSDQGPSIKGPYPLGDFGRIGAVNGAIIGATIGAIIG